MEAPAPLEGALNPGPEPPMRETPMSQTALPMTLSLSERLMRAALFPAALLAVLAIPGLALRVIADSLAGRLGAGRWESSAAWRVLAPVGLALAQVLMAPARPWVSLADALDDKARARAGRLGGSSTGPASPA